MLATKSNSSTLKLKKESVGRMMMIVMMRRRCCPEPLLFSNGGKGWELLLGEFMGRAPGVHLCPPRHVGRLEGARSPIGSYLRLLLPPSLPFLFLRRQRRRRGQQVNGEIAARGAGAGGQDAAPSIARRRFYAKARMMTRGEERRTETAFLMKGCKRGASASAAVCRVRMRC